MYIVQLFSMPTISYLFKCYLLVGNEIIWNLCKYSFYNCSCFEYLTFVRDRRNAPSYDENFGNVRAEYQVTYSSRGWPLGSHVRRLDDDNEKLGSVF